MMAVEPFSEKPSEVTIPANITVTLKQDKPASTAPDWERTARILSLVAIPVVLAIIGATIQATLGRSTVSRDYVQLAVSVLTAEKSKTPQELRDWAVDLLNENSPTKFSSEVAARLKGGEIGFPGSIAALLSTANENGGMAVSPDARLVAISQRNEIRIWELASGKTVGTSLRGHTDDVTSLAFSPDGRILASGSADKTVRIWDVPAQRTRSVLRGPTGVIVGLAFSPDGHLIIRSTDGTVSFWDIGTGQMLRRIELSK